MKKLFLLVIPCLAMNACSSTKTSQSPIDREAYNALAEASVSVSQSLTELGQTEQAAYPPVSVTEPPNPSTYGMSIPTSIDWDGPVEPLVKQIANAANYKFKVLGKAPAIPVVVSISAKNALLGDILRDVGYQSGKQAQIVVFPNTRTIELRYAN